MPPEQPTEIDKPKDSEESHQKAPNEGSDENQDHVLLKQKLITVLKWLKKAENSADRKMREEAMDAAIRRLRKIPGLQIPENMDPMQWISEQLKELDKMADMMNPLSDFICEHYPEKFFISRLPHRTMHDQPPPYFLEKAARSAADNNPKTALLYFNFYRDQTYAKEVLRRAVMNAADNDPEVALSYITTYIDEPYAHEIFEKVIKYLMNNNPRIILDYYERYRVKKAYQESLKISVQDYRNEDHELMLFQPYAESAFEISIKNLPSKNPVFGILYFRRYEGKTYDKEVFETCVRNLADIDPGAALLYFHHYQRQPYANEVYKKAFVNLQRIDPKAVRLYESTYKKMVIEEK